MGIDSLMKVSESDNGSAIELMVGQIFELELRENPTTGYRWEIEEMGSELRKLPKEKYLPDSKAVGSGGRRTMEFEALKTGVTKVRLVERRPWETDVPPVQKFEVRVSVISPWLAL